MHVLEVPGAPQDRRCTAADGPLDESALIPLADLHSPEASSPEGPQSLGRSQLAAAVVLLAAVVVTVLFVELSTESRVTGVIRNHPDVRRGPERDGERPRVRHEPIAQPTSRTRRRSRQDAWAHGRRRARAERGWSSSHPPRDAGAHVQSPAVPARPSPARSVAPISSAAAPTAAPGATARSNPYGARANGRGGAAPAACEFEPSCGGPS
jgi:hypothetical protein